MAEHSETLSEGASPPAPAHTGEHTLLELPSGKGMSATAASAITRQSMASVVLFAGTAESGKTTLLASLYLLFQKEPFAGYSFAWSQTLEGFEQRLYFARTASQREKPTTERTKISEYLHLRVRRSDLTEATCDVLLCDFSGEDFREAKDSSQSCKAMAIIRRADQFVLLIDGEKLARTESRQSAKSDPMTLLRNCLDTEMLGKTSAVDVLFTKWDIVESNRDKARINSFADYVEHEFRRRFSGRVRQLRVARVAAHPSEAELPLGFGLAELFPSWVDAARAEVTVRPTSLVEPPSLCEYDRYLRRQIPRLFRER